MKRIYQIESWNLDCANKTRFKTATKKRLWSVFFILLVSGCSSKTPPVNKVRQDVKHFVSTLPSEDRLFLEYFFRCLIQEDSIGYVLLGGKPMGFYSYIKPKVKVDRFNYDPVYALDLFFEGFLPDAALFHKGYDTWKKYEHLFCGNNIFFDLVEQDEELHFMKVSVMNKRLMLPLCSQYLSELKKYDSGAGDKEALFEALLHRNAFKEHFYLRDDLLGICLGYGEANARLFQKRANIFTSLGRFGFTIEKPSPKRVASLKQEAAEIARIFKGFRDYTSQEFLFHRGVSFVSDRSVLETVVLHEKYKNLHKTLTNRFSSESFLENTLELIVLEDMECYQSLPGLYPSELKSLNLGCAKDPAVGRS